MLPCEKPEYWLQLGHAEAMQAMQRGCAWMGRSAVWVEPSLRVILARVKELRDDSSPRLLGHPLAIWVSPSESLDVAEQSQAAPALPLSGFLTH